MRACKKNYLQTIESLTFTHIRRLRGLLILLIILNFEINFINYTWRKNEFFEKISFCFFFSEFQKQLHRQRREKSLAKLDTNTILNVEVQNLPTLPSTEVALSLSPTTNDTLLSSLNITSTLLMDNSTASGEKKKSQEVILTLYMVLYMTFKC